MKKQSPFRWLMIVPLLCVWAALPLFAQREQVGIRFEQFGAKALTQAGNPAVNGQNVLASQFFLNAGIRSTLDEEGNWMMINGFQYRYLNVALPVQGAAGVGNQVNKDFHALFYDFFLFRTLSEKFQAVVVLRPGIFSDFQNVALNHFRLEAVAFVDYFANDNLTLGLGVAYQTSAFGRLLTVPVAHIIWNSGDFLLDALLPSRATFWYYPSKQWEFGLDLWLNGSQYKMGNRPPGIDARAEDFYFANATFGPIIRYNLFEKTYLSLEGGYTIIRRMSFGTEPSFREQEEAKAAALISGSPIRLFGPDNTWVIRAGLQVAF